MKLFTQAQAARGKDQQELFGQARTAMQEAFGTIAAMDVHNPQLVPEVQSLVVVLSHCLAHGSRFADLNTSNALPVQV